MATNKHQLRMDKKLQKREAELQLLTGAQMGTKQQQTNNEETDPTQYATVSRELRAVKWSKFGGPSLCLTLDKVKGDCLSVNDLQSLLLYSVLGPNASAKPRWCNIKPWKSVSQAIMVVIHTEKTEFEISDYPFVSRTFANRVNVDVERESLWEELVTQVPLSHNQIIKEKLKEHGAPTLSAADSTCGPNLSPKTELLLSWNELVENHYPLSPNWFPDQFINSRNQYLKTNHKSPLFAVDCEMCLTAPNKHELTRISVIDENSTVVLDSLVKPLRPITDYLTKWSGITAPMLLNVQTRLEDIQSALQRLLPPDAILVGHSLNFDLKALRMCHPFVLDLSVCFNLSGTTHLKSSLQTLSSIFLNEKIQNSNGGHCSVEDAYATMQLAILKMEKGVQFGNVELGWNYNNFAEQNGLDKTSGKRKHSNNGAEVPAKRAKMDANDDQLTVPVCRLCHKIIPFNCRNINCICRRLRCAHCIDCTNLRNVPEVGGGEILDLKSALRLENASKSQTMQECLAANSKSLLSAPIDGSKLKKEHSKKIVLADSDTERIQKFLESMLENEIGIVEIDGNNSKCSDELISRITFSAPKRALISLLFVNEKSSTCYLKIKQ